MKRDSPGGDRIALSQKRPALPIAHGSGKEWADGRTLPDRIPSSVHERRPHIVTGVADGQVTPRAGPRGRAGAGIRGGRRGRGLRPVGRSQRTRAKMNMNPACTPKGCPVGPGLTINTEGLAIVTVSGVFTGAPVELRVSVGGRKLEPRAVRFDPSPTSDAFSYTFAVESSPSACESVALSWRSPSGRKAVSPSASIVVHYGSRRSRRRSSVTDAREFTANCLPSPPPIPETRQRCRPSAWRWPRIRIRPSRIRVLTVPSGTPRRSATSP